MHGLQWDYYLISANTREDMIHAVVQYIVVVVVVVVVVVIVVVVYLTTVVSNSEYTASNENVTNEC
jgi:uncharacterized membrane protein YdbT with pleckstrin-like domain